MSLRTDRELYPMVCALLLPALSGMGQTTDVAEFDFVSQMSTNPVRQSPDQPGETSQVADFILTKINSVRQRRDLSALAKNEPLQEAADHFARFMAQNNTYGHRADGRQPADRAMRHGYDPCTILENIAYIHPSAGMSARQLASEFVRGWLSSSGHRRNILHPYVSDTAIAVARSEETGYYYAVQIFGRPYLDRISFEVVNRSPKTVQYSVQLGKDTEKKTYELAPRTTRTHQVCRPPKVRFEWMRGFQEVESGSRIEVR